MPRATVGATAMPIRLRGADELAARFDALPRVMQVQILPFALRAGAEIVRDRARALAPVRLGRLRGGRWTLRKVTRRLGNVEMFVGVRIASPRRGDLGIPPNAKGYYPYAQNYGWRVGPRVVGPVDQGARVVRLNRKGRRYRTYERTKAQARAALQSGRRLIPGKKFMERALWGSSALVLARVREEIARRMSVLTAGAVDVARSREVA
ncbi:MAG: HK97 gp10 family phage protein [Planctomycetes bacterium]|nr:HK97 gp10 family phage protein [Planctomycetota bacterium]